MLSDRQKEQLSAEMIPLFQELEQDVIQDIARRVRKESRWTETAELQAKTLEAMGYKPMEIRNKVMRELKADKEYQAMIAKNTLDYKRAVRDRIKQLVADAKVCGDDIVSRAGTMAFNDDLAFWKSKGRHLRHSSELAEINTTASHRLAHELKNLTHSTGFKFVGAPIRIDNAFSHAMDSMIMNVATGTFSSGQAIEKVVSDLEKSGIRHVDFGSGTSRGIDVAAALAVRTTLGQMAAEISMDNAVQLGTDLVEVSSHAGAREGDGHADHAYWQGRVYSISGRQHPEEEKRLGYKIYKLSDVTGYPDDPLGLCGYNCRHTFYPFLEGISEPNPIEKDPEPVTVDERTYTYYQATQVQRRLERELRELKRQYIGGDETRLSAIKAKEQRYARFCSKAGLKQNLERLYVKGYKRDFEYIGARHDVVKKHDSLYRARNITSLEDLRGVSKSGIINMKSLDDVMAYFTKEHAIALIGFDKQNLDKVKTVLAGYDDCFNKFPGSSTAVKQISYNPKLRVYGKLKTDGSSEIGKLGLGSYGTGLHEAAHAADLYKSDYGTHSFADDVFSGALKKLKLRQTSKRYTKLAFEIVGEIDDLHKSYEILAYSLETAMGGGKGNELSETVVKMMEAHYARKD